MSGFSLDLPTEEAVKEELLPQIMPTEKEEVMIADTVKERANQIMNVNLDSITERKEITTAINDFGKTEIKACQSKNAILQKQIVQLQAAGGENGEVAKGLADLTIKMKDLDPSGLDFMKSGTLGKLFNPVRRYFERYKTADEEIAAIVDSLEKGKKTLMNDNTTLEIEEVNMRQVTKKMQTNIELGTQLDEYLTTNLEQARATGADPEKIRFIEEEILFPLRQRIQDFQQIQLVDQQGIIAMELIRKNNAELIRSVNRAQNVTVTALRTAVTVAGALYNQKIVLEKVNALNTVTNQMLESTSKMLHQQGAEIQRQASETAISAESLKVAFDETFAALEDISKYKQEALPRMRETIESFKEMAAVGEQRITEMERAGALLEDKKN